MDKMLRRLFYIGLVVMMLPMSKLNAQGVLIGRKDNTTNPYAKLEVYSTTSGLLIPRLTTEQMENIDPDNSAISLLIFNTDKNKFMFFNGSSWENIWSGSGDIDFEDLIKEALEGLDVVDWESFNNLVIRHENDSAALRDSIVVLRDKIFEQNEEFNQRLQNFMQEVANTYATKQEMQDSIASLRKLIASLDTIKQTSIVVSTLAERPTQGNTAGDVVIVQNNGGGYREVFIWADTNGDRVGDQWETIDKTPLTVGYNIYWFKRPDNKEAYDPGIFTSPFSTGVTAFSESGYSIQTSENFRGDYVFAYPDVWGKPQFVLNRDGQEYPIIDGMRMYPLEIDGIKYQVWTLFMDMTSTYANELKFKALN